MNAVSYDVAEMLEAYGESSGMSIDLTYLINLFIGREPSSPPVAVTIYDFGGGGSDLGLTNQGYSRPSFQVRVRHTKYLSAMNLAEEIKSILHGKAQETWNGTLYTMIRCISDPALLDYDENGNARVVVNFNVQRRSA